MEFIYPDVEGEFCKKCEENHGDLGVAHCKKISEIVGRKIICVLHTKIKKN